MCGKSFHPVLCHIIPSDILRKIAENGTPEQKDRAFRALNISAQMRGRREVLNNIAIVGITPTGTKRRTVFNAQNSTQLPGVLVRGEGSPASPDVTVNEAYNGAGKTYDFFKQVLNRNSIDARGMRLIRPSTTVLNTTTLSGTASR